MSPAAKGQSNLAAQTAVDFGLVIRTPMIEITTIGAGGGSIAWVDRVDYYKLDLSLRGRILVLSVIVSAMTGRRSPTPILFWDGSMSTDRSEEISTVWMLRLLGAPLRPMWVRRWT